jgi:hypothetical protein
MHEVPCSLAPVGFPDVLAEAAEPLSLPPNPTADWPVFGWAVGVPQVSVAR